MIRTLAFTAMFIAASGMFVSTRWATAQNAGAQSGETTKVEMPIVGRSVKGKIVPPKELEGVKAVPESSAHLIMPVALPEVMLPENILRLTPEQRLEWYNQWEKT